MHPPADEEMKCHGTLGEVHAMAVFDDVSCPIATTYIDGVAR